LNKYTDKKVIDLSVLSTFRSKLEEKKLKRKGDVDLNDEEVIRANLEKIFL
jgi:hypothetical protein